ncbi:hypothetical protein [Methyloceanibacter sp. wino2]|uniref:hypothetical protein n=1 Tax=Methyloceanibacter sp. wino2 TaxID=2170729 RepID=UPI00131F1AAD|nr:hypothetical protein [Methyloceanibacter sp. wino2]
MRQSAPNILHPRVTPATRRSLLLGTALASTLLIAALSAPTPAAAQATCLPGDPGVTGTTGPISIVPPVGAIDCVNDFDRANGGIVIELETDDDDEFIFLDNSGNLTSAGGRAVDILTTGDRSIIDVDNTGDIDIEGTLPFYVRTTGTGSTIDFYNTAHLTGEYRGTWITTFGDDSAITITNTGDVDLEGGFALYGYSYGDRSTVVITNSGALAGGSVGIFAATDGDKSRIDLTNSGAISVVGSDPDPVFGINAFALSTNSPITINNTANIRATSSYGDVYGVYGLSNAENSGIAITNTGTLFVKSSNDETEGINAATYGANSKITVRNTADITSIAGTFADAIDVLTDNDFSPVVVTNTGTLFVRGNGDENRGIEVNANGNESPITITNRGAITVRGGGDDMAGIAAYAENRDSPIWIANSGEINVKSSNGDADGIYGGTDGPRSGVTIINTAKLTVDADDWSDGIDAETTAENSAIKIINSGDIVSTARQNGAEGIDATTRNDDSSITVYNSGNLTVRGGDYANGIFAETGFFFGGSDRSAISITNRGNLDVTATREYATGIYARTYWDDSPISITNSGDITARTSATQYYATGIWADSGGLNSPVTIANSGSVYAEGALSTGIFVYSYNANKTTITNTGEIGASSHLAIDVYGQGTATIFNAGHITGYVKLTEQRDRFVNRAGGIFETKKTSLFGGGEDVFSNQGGATVLAATNANAREMSGFRGLETFKNNGGAISLVDGGVGDKFTIANTPGSADLKFEGGGYLAVDASLRGAGSKADNFIVDGDVSGVTKVMVNNTSTLPGVFNSQGIPVVFVEGQTPQAGNFVMADGPIDTGLFDYDLYFVPTGSGYWELRSFAGASAHMLPKLLTAAQDLWHETSSTWFDRTADLRVVLNGGGAPAYDAGAKSMAEPSSNGLTPGVWIKGGGSRLDRNGSATTSAYGRNYDYDLDNELSTVDLQIGVDMGRYDVLSEGDVLVFGVLGGFVGAGLDYDSLADSFNFSGGQVGAYATYLKDGLFVDTLLNVHLYEIDTPNLGFPDSLNATTVGLRTDAGYRFGSFTGGAFFEPLATIEIAWADIDGFNVGGNKVSFSDDANVRGRIGGRVGTTMEAWEGTMMEPFLIASLWGNLAEDNAATLVSSGTTFQFQDDLDDVWGELSAGVNLFNFSQTTAVFAKVDYTFGEDVQGLGGKAGMRVAW